MEDPAAQRARLDYGYHAANVLSYFLNPLVLPPVGFALVQWHLGAGVPEIAWTFAVASFFFCLVPLLYVGRKARLAPGGSGAGPGSRTVTGPSIVAGCVRREFRWTRRSTTVASKSGDGRTRTSGTDASTRHGCWR